MNDLNGQKLGESTLEITLAKPQGDRMKEKRRMREHGFRGGPPGPPGYVNLHSLFVFYCCLAVYRTQVSTQEPCQFSGL